MGAVGDALGAGIEFASWQEIQRRYGPEGLSDMPAGAEFTDDTQMTLFTAEGLIRTSVRQRGEGTTAHVGVGHAALLRWLQTQGDAIGDDSGWLITNQVLHRRRAPGNTCLSSLLSGDLGTVDDPINDSKGCGAVMRMAPVGLWFAGQPEPAWGIGCDLGALTHGHQDGYQSAGAFAAIVAGLAAGQPLIEAVDEAHRIAVRDGWSDTALGLEEAAGYVGAGWVDPDELCAELGQGWVGEEALAVAVGCCLAHDDPLAALRMSVNHRGDSDSTGSIVGNLLGLMHGTDWLPSPWLERVEGLDVVRTIAEDLWLERHEPPSLDLDAWFERYPGY